MCMCARIYKFFSRAAFDFWLDTSMIKHGCTVIMLFLRRIHGIFKLSHYTKLSQQLGQALDLE